MGFFDNQGNYHRETVQNQPKSYWLFKSVEDLQQSVPLQLMGSTLKKSSIQINTKK